MINNKVGTKTTLYTINGQIAGRISGTFANEMIVKLHNIRASCNSSLGNNLFVALWRLRYKP